MPSANQFSLLNARLCSEQGKKIIFFHIYYNNYFFLSSSGRLIIGLAEASDARFVA